jgi:hypothetical protein
LSNDLRIFTLTMKTIPLLLLFALPVFAIAQDSLPISRPVFLYGLAGYDIPGGFGFTIGGAVPFHSIVNIKTGAKKNEVISSELGEYRDPFAFTSVFFNAGFGIEYIRSSKHFTELSFSQGLFRTIYDGKVYELGPDGSIKERKLFGRNYLVTQVCMSLNYRIYKRNPDPWFLKFRPSAWLQYPYNSFFKFHFAIQAGVSYCLNGHSVS